MGITQERMIGMITEFRTYHTHTQKLITELKQSIAFYHKGELTMEEVVGGISVAITHYQPPPFQQLYIEEAHFRKMEKSNEKKKRYMQGKKILAGPNPTGHAEGHPEGHP